MTWRNPFVYFHSILDAPECAEANVGLPQLSADLKLKADKFPALAYIAPDETQLEPLVAEIKESLAYKDGGMIVITSAQAPQEGEGADQSGCCIDPGLPQPARRRRAKRHPPGRSTKPAAAAASACSSSPPSSNPEPAAKPTSTTSPCWSTIEELFALERIGYAAEPAITGFDESIFNAAAKQLNSGERQ